MFTWMRTLLQKHQRTSRTTSHTPPRARPGVETLESREMLDAKLGLPLIADFGSASTAAVSTRVLGDSTARAREVEVFKVKLKADYILTATTSLPARASTSLTPTDTYMRLFDAAGKQIAFDDDSNGYPFAKIVYAAPRDGIYYIGVSGYGNQSYDLLTGAGTAIGKTGSYRLTVQAIRSNSAPVFRPIADISTLHDRPVVISLSATDAESDRITYAASIVAAGKVAPASVRITGSSLRITPAAGFAGTLQVRATASDGRASAERIFNVTVLSNRAPVLDAITNQTVSSGRINAVVPLTATDPDGDRVTFSAAVPGKMAAVSINAGKLIVNPRDSYQGAVQVQVTASDGKLSATREFIVYVGHVPIAIVGRDVIIRGTSGNDIAEIHGEGGGPSYLAVQSYNRGVRYADQRFPVPVDASAELIIQLSAGGGNVTQRVPASSVDRIVFYGDAGADTIKNLSDTPMMAFGGDGNDFLLGGFGDDTLVGGNGDDFLHTGAGLEFASTAGGLCDGRGGNNIVDPGAGDDLVFLGDGPDKIVASTGTDLLFGGNLNNLAASLIKLSDARLIAIVPTLYDLPGRPLRTVVDRLPDDRLIRIIPLLAPADQGRVYSWLSEARVVSIVSAYPAGPALVAALERISDRMMTQLLPRLDAAGQEQVYAQLLRKGDFDLAMALRGAEDPVFVNLLNRLSDERAAKVVPLLFEGVIRAINFLGTERLYRIVPRIESGLSFMMGFLSDDLFGRIVPLMSAAAKDYVLAGIPLVHLGPKLRGFNTAALADALMRFSDEDVIALLPFLKQDAGRACASLTAERLAGIVPSLHADGAGGLLDSVLHALNYYQLRYVFPKLNTAARHQAYASLPNYSIGYALYTADEAVLTDAVGQLSNDRLVDIIPHFLFDAGRVYRLLSTIRLIQIISAYGTGGTFDITTDVLSVDQLRAVLPWLSADQLYKAFSNLSDMRLAEAIRDFAARGLRGPLASLSDDRLARLLPMMAPGLRDQAYLALTDQRLAQILPRFSAAAFTDVLNRLSTDRLSRILNGNVAAILVNGSLRILGSKNSDRIILTVQGGQLSVRNVQISTPIGMIDSLPAASLRSIVAFGANGDDFIDASAVSIPVYLDGGGGYDTLIGGSGNDVLQGGSQDDRLVGGDGDDYLIGGAGGNVIEGGRGNDRIVERVGNNLLDGCLLPESAASQLGGALHYDPHAGVVQDHSTGVEFILAVVNSLTVQVSLEASAGPATITIFDAKAGPGTPPIIENGEMNFSLGGITVDIPGGRASLSASIPLTPAGLGVAVLGEWDSITGNFKVGFGPSYQLPLGAGKIAKVAKAVGIALPDVDANAMIVFDSQKFADVWNYRNNRQYNSGTFAPAPAEEESSGGGILGKVVRAISSGAQQVVDFGNLTGKEIVEGGKKVGGVAGKAVQALARGIVTGGRGNGTTPRPNNAGNNSSPGPNNGPGGTNDPYTPSSSMPSGEGPSAEPIIVTPGYVPGQGEIPDDEWKLHSLALRASVDPDAEYIVVGDGWVVIHSAGPLGVFRPHL